MEDLFRDAPGSTRLVLRLRSRLTPYQQMASAMPASGRIVDLGCGWGLLSFALVRGSPRRNVVGVDHDPDRLRLANRAAELVPVASRPTFELGDVTKYLETLPRGSLAAVAMIDILHYFEPATQRALIANAIRALRPGGRLLVRDIDADYGIRGRLNKFCERVGTSRSLRNMKLPLSKPTLGITMTADDWLFFRGRGEWTSLLEEAGLTVRSQRSGPWFLADVLFIGERASRPDPLYRRANTGEFGAALES